MTLTEEETMDRDGQIRFDKNGPLDAFETVLEETVIEALVRGRDQYGETWLRHLDTGKTPLENARHTIEIHAETRIKEALECLDYGDRAGFEKKLGSAIGYLATAVCQVRYLTEMTKWS